VCLKKNLAIQYYPRLSVLWDSSVWNHYLCHKKHSNDEHLQKRNCQLSNFLSALFTTWVVQYFCPPVAWSHCPSVSVTCGFQLNCKQRWIHSVSGWGRLNLRGRQGKLGHCQPSLKTSHWATVTCSWLINQHAGRSDPAMACSTSFPGDKQHREGCFGKRSGTWV